MFDEDVALGQVLLEVAGLLWLPNMVVVSVRG